MHSMSEPLYDYAAIKSGWIMSTVVYLSPAWPSALVIHQLPTLHLALVVTLWPLLTAVS